MLLRYKHRSLWVAVILTFSVGMTVWPTAAYAQDAAELEPLKKGSPADARENPGGQNDADNRVAREGENVGAPNDAEGEAGDLKDPSGGSKAGSPESESTTKRQSMQADSAREGDADRKSLSAESDNEEVSADTASTRRTDERGPSEDTVAEEEAETRADSKEEDARSGSKERGARQGETSSRASEGEEANAAEAKGIEARPRRFHVLPRLGYAMGGFTNVEAECETTGDLGCGDLDIGDHAEASGVGGFLDGLYAVVPSLRLGVSASWVPSAKGDAGGSLRRLGTEIAVQGVLEGVVDASEHVGVTGRVQGGGVALIPQGFVDDQVDQAKADCDEAIASGVTCFVDYGTAFAPTFGMGAGLLWKRHGIRLDLLGQLQRLRIYRQEASTDTGSIDAVVRMHQSRFWILAGVEI